VADFQRQHPEVQVEIHTSDRPAQDLHQFDLTIVRQDDHLDADVVVRPVLDMNYVLCGSASYLQVHGVPAVPEDLSGHRMVRLRAPGTRLHAIELLNPAEGDRRSEVTPAWSVISNDDETAYQAALAGAGLTLLPELALTARMHGGQLRRVLAPWVSADRLRLVATMPSRRFLPLRTRAFLEFFVQHVQAVAAMAGAVQSLPALAVT
jgi:DNA-binding transcriptional LysR family regulator